MVTRVILGVLLGVLLVAFSPWLMQGLPYVLLLVAIGISFFFLRAAPALAEPLGYGLLVVLLCYIIYMLVYRREKLKQGFVSEGKLRLPTIKIDNHPNLSVILNTLCYMLGLTFVLYFLILLIYVQ